MAKLSENLIEKFEAWLVEAAESEPNDPNAMALATADARGMPNVRMVLLKDSGAEGFTFFTNKESQKGGELAENSQASLLFHWKTLRRQVRVRGTVSAVSEEVAQAYYDTRPRLSRIGAWASRQSRPMEGRFEFEAEIAKYSAKYAVGAIPKPDYWGGYMVEPLQIEFWRDRPHRLHERLIYFWSDEAGAWEEQIWYP